MSTFDIAVIKGVAPNEPESYHKITNRNRVSAALQKIDTAFLNSIPDDIITTDEIDSAIGALIYHVRTVVDNNVRTAPASTNYRKLPADVFELIRAKNATLRRTSAYPTTEYRDDAEIAECLADNIVSQYFYASLPHDISHIHRIEEESRIPQSFTLSPLSCTPQTRTIYRIRLQASSSRYSQTIPRTSALGKKNQLTSTSRGSLMSWVDGSAPGGSKLTRISQLQFNLNTFFTGDRELRTIAKYMKDVSKRFFDIAESHLNAFLRSVASYVARPYHLICRPRNVLIDPPNALTAKVKKLIEVNDTHD
ncbi:hypothetical protein EVAR_29115_1 [Eumeta japonica]|uniref:Uncharacterized protein n=1 Tax=Eumeta variegata TaxID=151549 RepID=A0A4C1VQ28_EUMVA|nr:hypothetical protein EVAR_29115_1 [Eumeta japonica]